MRHALLFLAQGNLLLGEGGAVSHEERDFFENKIRPVLATHCMECHSAARGKVKGGLSLDTREETQKGGENGAVIQPGDPQGSALIRAVEWSGELQMPPKSKLSVEQIQALREWVRRGAADPREGLAASRVSRREHWAFQPVVKPVPPRVKNEAWVKNAIDRFVLSQLEKKDMLPSDPPETGNAEEQRRKKEALLRRAYFDLIGIPPSVEEISHYVADASPQAFEKVVDRLLNSPAYGERWARHWMDTARYSDTTGDKKPVVGRDYRYPYAWTYRDWLIRAINSDMPYDQFIMNQLAADCIEGNSKEHLAALGFITVGERFVFPEDTINDRIDVVGRGFLGLTLACARCHDHKFDPVKMADYYALKGVFQSIVEPAEGPRIPTSSSGASDSSFEKKKEAVERRIYGRVLEMQSEISEKFRKRAAAYFKLAYLERYRKRDIDAQKLAAKIVQDENMTPPEIHMVYYLLLIHASTQDPVFGPFFRLILPGNPMEEATRKSPERELLTPQRSACQSLALEPANPMVLDYLSHAGIEAGSLESVAALFEKFVRERVGPLIEAGILKRCASSQPLSQEEHSALQLACFPILPQGGWNLGSIQQVRELCKFWGNAFGGQLQETSGLNRLNTLELSSESGARAMAVADAETPRNSPLFPRGNPPKTLEERQRIIPRRFIEFLSPGGRAEPFRQGSGRLELAKAVASRENPITARVLVNRVWMYHFGEGFVRTPDDLGNQSGVPVHLELLNFLSAWFMEDFGEAKPAWSVKALHKAIMLSNTYQQSSRNILMEKQSSMDPGNELLWRANVRRLDFEAFRDALLAISGQMDSRLYGPPLNIVSEPYSLRRSVYGYIDRGHMADLLSNFDMPSPGEPNTRRTSTMVPQQALFLINSPFTIGLVQKIAQRRDLYEAVSKDTRLGIISVFRMVFQRTPTLEEIELAYQFLEEEARRQPKEIENTRGVTQEAQKLAEEKLKLEKASLEKGGDARQAVLNEGQLVKRTTLSPWESLIQALMFSNEAAYIH